MPIADIYFIAPLLIKQPTWGGTYITSKKNITESEVTAEAIGQSYELSAKTGVTPFTGQLSESIKVFGLADSSTIDKPKWFGDQTRLQTIQEIIAEDSISFIGERALSLDQGNFPILIKFTQAQENSYQLHVRPDHTNSNLAHWKAKPESWYFLEEGTATLGIRPNINLKKYQHRCQEIYEYSHKLSLEIKSGHIELNNARKILTAYINNDHPHNYVNTVQIPAKSVINLSQGGIHHSWETTPHSKLGNIVYEVQRDVLDDASTLRSFDQAKIKDDGSIRSLTIDDYFAALDVDPIHNNPENLIKKNQTDPSTSVETPLFDTSYYKLTHHQLTSEQTQKLNTNNSFQHIFNLKGTVQIKVKSSQCTILPGWSVLIPAGAEEFMLSTHDNAEVLITSV